MDKYVYFFSWIGKILGGFRDGLACQIGLVFLTRGGRVIGIDPATSFSLTIVYFNGFMMGGILLILVCTFGCLDRIIKDGIGSKFARNYSGGRALESYLMHKLTGIYDLLLLEFLGYLNLGAWLHKKYCDNITSSMFFGFFNTDFYELYIGIEWVPRGITRRVDFFKRDFLPYLISYKKLDLIQIDKLGLDRKVETNLILYMSKGFYFSEQMRKTFYELQFFSENSKIDLIGSIIPSGIIASILMPSLVLLYSLDEPMPPHVTIKIIGHQGFGNYGIHTGIEMSMAQKEKIYNNKFIVFYTTNFDSVLVNENELYKGTKRLLEVDRRLLVPINIPIRFLITSGDVLHSGAMPDFGVKVDAIPGRLNEALVLLRYPGIFYGQCSELCGIGHGFMPICVQGIIYGIGISPGFPNVDVNDLSKVLLDAQSEMQ